MKTHTTNYINTFIEVAEDCPSLQGMEPPVRGDKKSIANYQFELLQQHPYQYTSDDIFFSIYAKRNELLDSELDEARLKFFSKGQPCFRASPLTKRYGWGIHSNAEGKVAMYGVETEAYERLRQQADLKTVKAMRSKRK